VLRAVREMRNGGYAQLRVPPNLVQKNATLGAPFASGVALAAKS